MKHSPIIDQWVYLTHYLYKARGLKSEQEVVVTK